MRLCNGGCIIIGIIIIDIDHGFRQDFPEVLYDLFYGPAFIEAGDQNGCFIHVFFLGCALMIYSTGVSFSPASPSTR